ncbi:MAG TPA: hypothetical protein VNH22_05030 [Blastocatellia bacterium]|jgi:hypothetical protein|nr:hypothetical protein [Blastocatellia bacterium]
MIRLRKVLFIAVWSLLLPGSTLFQAAARSPAGGDFPVGSYVDGDFIATFTPDGKLFVHSDDFLKAEAAYTVEGDQITIKDKKATGECGGAGRYKWRFDGKALSFTRVEDACKGRARHLTSRRWPMI